MADLGISWDPVGVGRRMVKPGSHAFGQELQIFAGMEITTPNPGNNLRDPGSDI